MTTPPDEDRLSPGVAAPPPTQPDAISKLLDPSPHADGSRAGVLLRALIDASPLAMWVLDPAGIVHLWNPAAEQLTGWRADEVIGRPLPIIPPDKTEEFQRLLTCALNLEPVSNVEVQRTRKDGSPLQMALSNAPLIAADGTVPGVLVMAADLTARKQADATSEQLAAEQAARKAADAARDELAASEARFRSLAQASAQIVWTTDPDGRFVTPLPQWGAVTGQSEDAIRGYGMLDAVHPDDRSTVEKLWMESIATKQPFSATFRLRVASGDYRWYAARGVPVVGADGAVREWVGTSTDIHEQQTTEAALRDSESRFRRMADDMPVMLWVTEADGTCTFLNRQWYEFTGQTPDVALGFGWLKAVHPDDRQRSEDVFLAANAAREPFALEYRLRDVTGEYRWAIDSAKPRFDPNREFLGYIGTVTDISDRRRMEDAIRTSERRYRRIFDTAEVSIWEEDFSAVKAALDELKAAGVADIRAYLRDHPEFVGRTISLVRVVDVNQASLHMFGARDKAELTTSLDRIFTPGTQATFAEQLVAIFERKGSLQSEAPLRSLDGRELQVAFTIAFPGDDPELRSVLVSLLDISERKRAEAERERLLDAERAAHAEAERARSDADAARAAAEEASRAKSEFLATMSHELRTPLNAIIGYENLLADGVTGPITDAQRRQLDRIGASAHHLLMLIDEVLTLSRVEAGKETVSIEPVDVSRVLDESATIIEPLAQQKNLTFRVEPPPTAVIHTDPGKLRQALLNLLSNAVKFTGRGSIILRATLEDDTVAFEVQDTGIGIAAEHRDQIFEPFWQVESSTTRTAQGTGLGLAVTRRLAHLLGGEVRVQSSLGDGSTFTLRLPRSGPQAS